MFADDDFSAIATRYRELRKERGVPDDNWRTALGSGLDTIAAFYGLDRFPMECDADLRTRIETALRKKQVLL